MSNVSDETNSEEIRDAIKTDGDSVRGHLDELADSKRNVTCPHRGSSEFRRVESRSAHFVYGRICQPCETIYTPPTPRWIAAVGVLAGLGIVIIAGTGGVLFLLNRRELDVRAIALRGRYSLRARVTMDDGF